MSRVPMLCSLIVVFAVMPVAARADRASVGVSFNWTFGTYQTGAHDARRLPVLPMPIFEVRVPIRRFEIYAEGLPPIGPVSYSDGLGADQSTKISYGAAELRYAFAGDRYVLGAGATLLNQATFYPYVPDGPYVSQQSSRVAGFRFSARIRLSAARDRHTDVYVAASPGMHAVQRTVVPLNVDTCFIRCHPLVLGANDPESASLIDAKLTQTREYGRFTLSYGLRYLNYVAHYPQMKDALADHDRFVMPFLGMTVHLGR
ncbi:MAG: hypothetical protein ACXWNJ_06665 [Vulcanimicrobiaceae bacterium]